ncbi:MAG: chromosome segregation protein SMC [Lachnospiraceae bacterium]|nr:chromosome segregation protein SMC [Lachnospiraceae bacterium]
MYLKSIEVQGFKSFANKLLFEFHNGITGIVGPNGSGKSNVADAVRWVFGEQSAKQLRGGSMQDVIFAGTELRKRQSFASVSITLDNSDRALSSDSDEVVVTRKLYRSGESEYLLNGSACRLKDIYEIFYDTGIGKEGYSIIGQGQIDRILSVRPEERRELFDEAAGIVRYKKRKAAAEKKLESEEASMVRVTDIISELERQVGPLYRQSETAKEYLKLRDELRSLDINAFLYDYSSLNENLEKNAENRETVEKQLGESREQEQALRETYDSLDAEVRDLDEQISGLREEMQEASGRAGELNAQVQVDLEKINTLNNDARHYEDRIAYLDSETARITVTVETDREELEKTRGMQAELAGRIRTAELEAEASDARLALIREEVAKSQGDIMDILNERSGFTARLQHFDTLNEENGHRKEELSALKARLSERLSEIENAKAALSLEIAETEETVSEKRAELEDLKTELADAEEDCRVSERRVNDLMQRYQIERSRLDTVRNLAERYEGYGSAVRRVMEEKKSEKGILGVVADLISVEPAYETAIETALGGSIQNIVTEDEDTAKRMIALLKENKAGRATFLPLESIEPRKRPDERILKERGMIGFADSLVKCDKRIEPIVRYLLGHFVVAEDIDNALSAAKKYHHSIRIVTKEGESLSIGGALSGGAFRNNANLLGRSRELQSLEKSVQKAREEGEEENRKLNLKKQLRGSLSVETDDLSEELSEINMKLRELTLSLDQRERERIMTEAEQKEAEHRLSELENELALSENDRKAVLDAMEKLESRGTEQTDLKERSEKLLAETEAERETLAASLSGLRVELAKLDQAESFLTDSIERLLQDIDQLRTEKQSLAAQSGSVPEELQALREEIEVLQKEMGEADSEAGARSEKVDELTKLKNEKAEEQRRFFDERDALSTSIADLTKEQLRLEMQREKAEEKLDVLTEYLWSEYQLTPSEAEHFRDDTLKGHTALKREVNGLKAQIRALGNVNVNAIEQYKEVSLRYEFMKAQYEDLTVAEKKLREIIEELETGMRKQFTEAFESIRTEFNVVFRELFGGGSGTITLDEDADVINAGVSIIAQPPGKKLQNMMQLSGGEKALTAIALIFAIQRLRPAPFCLLDEIEASLDDSNVGRFTDYLKKLSDRIQFIVITHRRGTMTASDRLYGITMQERGVSTLVSVNLIEEQLTS